jgi:uncharacterized protein (TIGR03663 family)
LATKVKKLKPQAPITKEEIIAESTTPEIEAEPGPPAWLTLETLLYALVFMIGLALRLWQLGAYPLADYEALPSLLAHQLYGGQTLETTASYSPLLVSLNSLTFLLIHESDASARFMVAIFGSTLILLPVTLRRQLDPLVCLLASALLAISPAAIFLSRTINSEIAVAVGALMVVSGFFNWVEDGLQRWLYLLAAGLAMLLTAEPMAYSIIIVFAVIILLRLADFKTLWAQGLRRSVAVEAVPRETKEGKAPSRSGSRSKNKGLNPNLRRAGIFLLVAIILFSTAATLNLSGFGVTTNLLADWLSRFGVQSQAQAGFNAVFLLTIYEPLLVVSGLVGLVYALLSRNLLRLVFAGWFLGILVLDLAMVGRPNGNVILSLLPLVFLAALALAELWPGLQQGASWANEGIILASGLVIAGFGYIGLTGWLIRECAAEDTFCQLAWLQAGAALALFLVIAGFFWFINGPETAIRGIALTGVTLGLIAAINIGWRLNYGPLMNLAYQPLAGVPASTELVSLTETLAGESSIRVGDETLLDISLVGATPALQWQLRNYRYQTQAGSISEAVAEVGAEAPTATAIITPTPAGQELAVSEAYIGQDFVIDAIWSPVGLSPKNLINWLIFREINERPEGNKVILWLRLDQR